MEKIPMTAAGYEALEAELRLRQAVERPRIIQAITEARGHGDLSENAEYHAAKETQSLNEGRIAELEDKISRADVIDLTKLSGDTITFGATVTLVDEDTDEERKFQIVGEPEAELEGRENFRHFADRACADRQEKGCLGRGHDAEGRERLRSPENRLALIPVCFQFQF